MPFASLDFLGTLGRHHGVVAAQTSVNIVWARHGKSGGTSAITRRKSRPEKIDAAFLLYPD
jgi:hypothetical protein